MSFLLSLFVISFREIRLRELIIEGSAPLFKPDGDVSEESLSTLNSDQKAVVRKVKSVTFRVFSTYISCTLVDFGC